MGNDFPTTVDAAVRILKYKVDEKEQGSIAQRNYDELYMLQFTLGLWIRNNFGFYKGNTLLINDTGTSDIDEASMVIIKAFWSQLRNSFGIASSK